MKIDIEYLKKKLHTLDRGALLILREMLKNPEKVTFIKQVRDNICSGISKGGKEAREEVKELPISEDLKGQFESYSIFHELKMLDMVDSVAEKNIKELLKEIDKILSQSPQDKNIFL